MLATDPRASLVAVCTEQVRRARFEKTTQVHLATPDDAKAGPFEAVVCTFGMFKIEDRSSVLRAWGNALTRRREDRPAHLGSGRSGWPARRSHRGAARGRAWRGGCIGWPSAFARRFRYLFDSAGLALVRHTVLHHTLTFATAEAFVHALTLGSTWGRLAAELGDVRFSRVTARFYDMQGGPRALSRFVPPPPSPSPRALAPRCSSPYAPA